MFDIDKIIRENIRNLIPYSSARDEYSGKEAVFLDANENPYNTGYNRYPDPYQWELKKRVSEIKNIPVENIFLGNGSDEAIDLLPKAFCRPGIDNLILLPPTYGMYKVSADINQVQVKNLLLTSEFLLNLPEIEKATDSHTKMIFVCSPNNPTANSIPQTQIESLLRFFPGIVVVDEAYVDFSSQSSISQKIGNYPNLVVLQTFSKAYGLAAIRLGIVFASKQIISILNKIKLPYNVNQLTQEYALKNLQDISKKDIWIKEIIEERQKLEKMLLKFTIVLKVYPSDANFLLVKVTDPGSIYRFLVERKVIVRDRSKVALCEGCLRITVGTKDENSRLVAALKEYENKEINR